MPATARLMPSRGVTPNQQARHESPGGERAGHPQPETDRGQHDGAPQHHLDE